MQTRCMFLLLVLVLAACSENEAGVDSTVPPPTPTVSVTSTTRVSEATTSTWPVTTVGTTIPEATTVPVDTTEPAPPMIEVSGGAVSGPEKIEVALGAEVRFVVVADAVDEIHVHGYDLLFDLTAGSATTVSFIADVPGVFEVELEDGHVRIVELVVSP